MRIKLLIGDPVINKKSREKGTVTDVSEKYGWFIVKYNNGRIRRYECYAEVKDCSVMIDLESRK